MVMISLEEILDETNQLDVSGKTRQWLQQEALNHNPKIEVKFSIAWHDLLDAMILMTGDSPFHQLFHICKKSLKDSLTPHRSMGGV